MANPNKPAGLVPVQYLNGAPWNGQGRTYYIPSSDANAYAIGDPVVSVAGGDSNGVAQVTLATAGAGNPLRGCVVGVGIYEYGMYNPNNLNTTVVPASKNGQAYYVMVADDPQILFQIQEGNTTTYLTAANINQNANLFAGTNNGYASGWTLNNSGVANTANFQLKIMMLQRTSDNTFGQYAKWLVRINNHELANQTII
jgi:hypothetical protein